LEAAGTENQRLANGITILQGDDRYSHQSEDALRCLNVRHRLQQPLRGAIQMNLSVGQTAEQGGSPLGIAKSLRVQNSFDVTAGRGRLLDRPDSLGEHEVLWSPARL
jgi:hypothetical protein